MNSPSFPFKHPFPTIAQPTTPSTTSTQLSARNFVLSHRRQPTPASSIPSVSPAFLPSDDIEDRLETPVLRKRIRKDTFHELSSEEEGDVAPPRSSGLETSVSKRPPVIVPQVSPASSNVEFSPSRKGGFLANGLAEYATKIIRDFRAVSSVAVPRLDHEDKVKIIDSKLSEGGLGWMCRVSSSEGRIKVMLFLRPTGLTTITQVKNGDTIAISNVVELDDTWICGSWRYTSDQEW
jgi:hypothetical protein